RVGQLGVEVLEREVEAEPVRVLAEQRANRVGVGRRCCADHETSLPSGVDCAAPRGDNAVMRIAEGFVVAANDVASVRAPGDTAEVRTTIDAASGCERLEQRIIGFSPGRSLPRGEPGRQEVLFVASGSGALQLDGVSHTLERWTGAFVAPGESYTIETSDGLTVVSVSAPASDLGIGEHRRVTVRYEEQPVLPASSDREFRYLVNQDAGCLDVTQFVGVIPPGRAPEHS